MKVRTSTLVPLATLLLLLGISPLLADHHSEAPEGASEADVAMALMKAAAPGAPHEKLAKGEGTWNMEIKMWMAPGAEPTTSKAVAKRKMIMDGRYQVEDVTGNFMGMPFTGHGMTGYDNITGTWWGTWIDNMSTGVMTMTGEHDEASNTTTYWTKAPNPMTGQIEKGKTVIHHLSDDKEVMVMYTLVDDQEIKAMEITSTRADS